MLVVELTADNDSYHVFTKPGEGREDGSDVLAMWDGAAQPGTAANAGSRRRTCST